MLGVEELEDKTLHPIDLPFPEKLIKDFWDTVNNRSKVSVNILSSKDVYIQSINDKKIVVINVPRAQRYYKPVYLNENPISGSYRRNGEGDYHCAEEIKEMYRDANIKTQDLYVLENVDYTVFF